MLSIRFDADREWWVSGEIFECLFRSALDAGELPASAEEWMHIAGANGGLDLSAIDPETASSLVNGLRRAAQRELTRYSHAADQAIGDAGFARALRRLVDATEPLPREA